MADLTLRLTKGSPVTFAEMDSNLLALDSDSPWKVSDGHITYQGKVGIGYGVDSNYRPQYHLDFGVGDSNQQASIGTDADLGLYLDNSTTFSIYNDGTEAVLVDENGRVGIGITVPNQPLDVAGNIQSTATMIANQGFFQSVYDGTMTIAAGTIFNGVNATFAGTINFGQLDDGTNTVIGFELDELSGSTVILPTSSAIKFSLDSEVNVLLNLLDSEHAFNIQQHANIDSDARANEDSDRADLLARIDSDHAWANTYINNIDSDAKSRDDSEHAWALNYFNGIDSALDSEHAWNVAEHTTLQNNIDSEHNYTVGQVNLLNDRVDSEHTWNVTEHASLKSDIDSNRAAVDARIDSDHLWAVRNFDSDHAWAVNNFDSEHFWAKAYVEAGDSVVDSELQKQIRIQNALNDSEHAWNVAEHGELQQNIDSRADSEHAWNVASHNALQANIDSDHAWANTYISNVDSDSRSRDDSDHAWANTYFNQINARLDSEHAYAVAEFDSEHQRMLRDVDSDHQWAVTNFTAITNANDSEHAWNVAEHAKLDSNIDSLQRLVLRIDSDNDADRNARFDSEHAWNVQEHNTLRSEIDSDHAWAVSEFDSTWQAILAIDSANDSDRAKRFDSEHAWNVQEHNTLRSEIDSDHAWAVSNFDSEHTYNVTQHTNLQNNIDSNLTRIESLDSNLDSEHAWNVAEHTQLRSEIDSDHAWAVSKFDSEHAWNVTEHQALEDSLNTLIQNFNAFTGGQDSSYTSKHFDSDFTRSSTDSLSEGTNNLYYTTARADSDAKRAVSGGNGIDYDSSTGVIRTDSQANVVFNDLILTGDLTVQGGQTIINTENLNVSDTRITLNDSSPATNVNDIGFIFERGNDSSATFFFDESEDKFTLGFTDDSGRENGDIGVTVGTLVANIEGDVTGQVSDISNHTTDQLAEGATNLYYTTARADSDAKHAITATAPVVYDNNTGNISIPSGNLGVLTINGVAFDPVADSDKSLTLAVGNALSTTDSLPEGTTNLYYTQARAQTDFDSGLATKTTDDVAEGTTNLYYTQSRAQTDFDSGLATKTTDDLTEGTTNLYYTQTRAQTDFDSGLATKTTDDVAEGTTNLYYTQARAQTDFDSGLATKTTTDLAEGTNLYYTNSRWDSDLDSAIAAGKIAAGRALTNTDSLAEGSVNLYYTQARAQTDFDSGLATKTTDNLTEGTTNLYYTQARAQTDFDSGMGTKTTTDLAEGTNLYYTTARADSDAKHALSATAPVAYDENTGVISIPAGNLGVLTLNGQAFDPLADSDKTFTFAARELNNTDSLAEGTTNLYYTKDRWDSALDSAIAAGKIATENYNSTDSLPEGTTNLYYTNARFDSDLDSAIQAGKISLWDSAKTVGVVDSYVDSDFVQLHQRFLHLNATAPTGVQQGELWLDIDDSSAGVRIWDGTVWFEFPNSCCQLGIQYNR